MITCISNNFGVLPTNIQLKDYQSQDIIVLQGMFSVDTTDEDYQAAGVLRITMPNFAFRNSPQYLTQLCSGLVWRWRISRC